MADSPLLTRLEAAAYLNVSARTFDVHVRFNTGPRVDAVRIGGRVLFRREDLDGWIVAQAAAQLEQERARGELAEVLAVNGLERRSVMARGAAPPAPAPAADSKWLRVLHSPRRAREKGGECGQ
ncbi:MAG: hypothetical protein IPM35_04195 [Myxococcales bacterium]|nr:hypothetical protein [Myxococcales bacterium]